MLSRKIHISWHIAWLACGVLCGTALAAALPPALFGSAAWLLATAALCIIVAVKRTAGLIVPALIAGLFIGMWRGSVEQLHLEDYTRYYGQSVTVRGKIVEDTSFDSTGSQRIRLGEIRINHAALHGQVWASTPSSADVKRGDIATLNGVLSEGFGNLPAAMHRATIVRIERPHPGDVARRARDWFAGGVRAAVPEPEASLGIGYLTGQRSSLPEELDEQLRILGLTHIVVASGYNLTILVRLARRLLAGVSKYLSMLSAGTMIIGFMAVTGMSPSMSRAGLVAGLSLAAWYYGRKIHPFVLLPFAAAITALVNPAYVWGDIGWYLSFSSFVGVIVLAPLIQHYFWGSRKPGIFRQILIDTLSAQIITLPIIALVFGEYSPLALPANLLILPFVPLAMLLVFVSGVASICAPFTAAVAGTPVTLVLQYMTSIVQWMGGLPWAQGELVFGPVQLIASYTFLLFVMLFLRHKTRHNFREENIVE
jgi:competence protein ComEC